VELNDISLTTAEAVDIKEGTTGGTLRKNRFAGAGMTAADSWVDVKGNGWTIAENTGNGGVVDGFSCTRWWRGGPWTASSPGTTPPPTAPGTASSSPRTGTAPR